MSPPGYPREVRVAVCGEYLAALKPLKQIAAEHGIADPSLITHWIRKAGFKTRRAYDGHVGRGRGKKL